MWLVLGVPAAPAAAHGGPPRTRAVVFHPTDPDRFLLQTSYGLVLTDDGGDSWRWVCPQAASWLGGEDPPFVVTANGTILAALAAGVSRGDPTACGWDFPSSDVEGTFMADVRVDPADPLRVLAVESNGFGDNRVLASTDGGESFRPTAQDGRPILFERLRFAPSEPSRVYLSGGTPPTSETPRTGVIFRSDDGGETFPEEGRFPVPVDEDSRAVRVVAVDPTDPDVVYLQVAAFDADDELRRSDDGGEVWTTVLSIPAITGVAVSGDGGTVWATGIGGLYRSVGGAPFEVLDADLEGLCLERRGETLWMCGQVSNVGFGLARSDDGGETFVPVFDDQGIVPADCPSGTEAGAICPAWLFDLCFDLGLEEDFCPDPPPAPDAGLRDAGPSADAGSEPPERGGGGCGVSASAPPLAGWWVALAGANLLLRRRRRP